jgi:hypothetical protein
MRFRIAGAGVVRRDRQHLPVVRVGQGMRRLSVVTLAGRELRLYETVVFLGRAEPRASSGCYPLSGEHDERRSE